MKYIDLKLPSGTLWADRNVGAEKSEDYGNYLSFDGAQRYGLMPTNEQIEELLQHTEHKVCVIHNIHGMQFIGQNSNSIFMPLAGYLSDINDSLNDIGSNSSWWSCTPTDIYSAYYLYLNDEGYGIVSNFRSKASGFSVRLVKIKQ